MLGFHTETNATLACWFGIGANRIRTAIKAAFSTMNMLQRLVHIETLNNARDSHAIHRVRDSGRLCPDRLGYIGLCRSGLGGCLSLDRLHDGVSAMNVRVLAWDDDWQMA